MVTFEDIWQLLYDHGSSNYYKRDAAVYWEGLTEVQQQKTYDRIRHRLEAGLFVAYNPVDAIHDNVPARIVPIRRTMTYQEYFSTYRTTEAKDGWQMRKDREGKVYYEHVR
ncbi:MAG: hypothetical protein IJT12_09690 [Paludibacteraceae bacterium]|nr:hypothetical protein [Paludibacteraceae bacterium]